MGKTGKCHGNKKIVRSANLVQPFWSRCKLARGLGSRKPVENRLKGGDSEAELTWLMRLHGISGVSAQTLTFSFSAGQVPASRMYIAKPDRGRGFESGCAVGLVDLMEIQKSTSLWSFTEHDQSRSVS